MNSKLLAKFAVFFIIVIYKLNRNWKLTHASKCTKEKQRIFFAEIGSLKFNQFNKKDFSMGYTAYHDSLSY